MLKACVTSEFDLSGKDAVASCVAAAASVQFHRFAARVRKHSLWCNCCDIKTHLWSKVTSRSFFFSTAGVTITNV